MGNLFQQFINGDFDSSTSSDEHETNMMILGALEHERIERDRRNHGEHSRRLLRNKKKKRKGGKTRDCFHIGETTLFAASDIHSVMADPPRHTCLKLEISNNSIFIKATWFQTHFHLSITDGLDAWICNASEAEVKERATQWDQPLSEYLQLAERYLGFQQPGSVYGFADAGDGHKRLSWTFEKEGTKLEWRWKCQPSPNSKLTTAGILDFLMDANIRLSEEVVRKSQSFEKLKVEAEKCLAQSEKFSTEKAEFESAIYAKFLGVLNSKKAKLRELQEQLSKQETAGKMPQEDEEITDKTESFDDESDDEKSEEEPTKNLTGTSKPVPASRLRGRKRITRK